MSPVAVSADRRFHRAHVKPSRRRAMWRTVVVSLVKYVVVVAAAIFVASKAVWFARESPLLAVRQIVADGNGRLSSDEITGLLDDLRGENILLADLERWRGHLLASPWIEDATLRRSLPSTIEVTVRERQPIAIGRVGGQLYLVDERGVAIDKYRPDYAGLDLPIVDGFSVQEAAALDNAERGALAARLILAVKQRPEIAGRLSQVDVSDQHNARVLLSDDPAELRLGEDHFLERVESYLSLASALRERVPEIDYVDLRFDGRVYVKPTGRTPIPVSSGTPKRRPAAARRR
ncbi:MAG: cell division protein FtsQ/DivIB [Vicinamibacterales bacterium]